MSAPVAHWRDRDSAKTLCGRLIAARRVHSDWPRCKTCDRIQKASGLGYVTLLDADGFYLPPCHSSINGNFTLDWTFVSSNGSAPLGESL